MVQLSLLGWVLLGLTGVKLQRRFNAAHVARFRAFTFRWLAPCLIFYSLYRAELTDLPQAGLFLSYFGTLILLFAGFVWWQKQGRASTESAGVNALTALYPNAIGVGIPLVLSLFGEQGLVLLMMIIMINLLCVLPAFNLWLSVKTAADGPGLGRLLRDPLILAVFAGLTANLSGLVLPEQLLWALGWISKLAIPVILVALGAELAFFPLHPRRMRETLHLVAIKLVLFPVLVAIAAIWLFKLDPLATQVAVLVASLPSGINAYLYADRFGVSQMSTAGTIVITTLGSFATVQAWAWLIGRITI